MRFSARLQIGNTDLRLLNWVQSHFGGTVSLERRNNLAHKQIFRWLASADDLDALIPALLPYLIVKRDQAELVLAYRATLPPKVRTHRSTHDRPQHITDERLKLRERLQALNKRGIA